MAADVGMRWGLRLQKTGTGPQLHPCQGEERRFQRSGAPLPAFNHRKVLYRPASRTALFRATYGPAAGAASCAAL